MPISISSEINLKGFNSISAAKSRTTIGGFAWMIRSLPAVASFTNSPSEGSEAAGVFADASMFGITGGVLELPGGFGGMEPADFAPEGGNGGDEGGVALGGTFNSGAFGLSGAFCVTVPTDAFSFETSD